MDEFRVKQETIEHSQPSKANPRTEPSHPVPVIDLSSSDSDSYSSSSSSSSSTDEDDDFVRVNGKRSRVSNDGVPSKNNNKKKKKLSDLSVVLPAGFLDPLPAKVPPAALETQSAANVNGIGIGGGGEGCKQFWKAGDFEGTTGGDWDMSTGKCNVMHVKLNTLSYMVILNSVSSLRVILFQVPLSYYIV